MKLFTGMLAAAVLAAAMGVGCSESPRAVSRIEPSIQLTPGRTIEVGEATRVRASTQNLVGAKGIQWAVSPNVGHIRVENDSNGQTALFSADQPGVYVVTARADMGNGQMVRADTTITVNGRPVTSDRMPEPAQPPR